MANSTDNDSGEALGPTERESALTGQHVAFHTRPDSPWSDGYDIQAEYHDLQDLIDTNDPDSADPRYPRYIEYLERESDLETARAEHAHRNAAEPQVPREYAAAPGRIQAEAAELTIHTFQAQRVWIGERPTAERPHGSVGVLRAAGALTGIYRLTGADHPYADWALIQLDQALAAGHRWFNQRTRGLERLLEQRSRQGLAQPVEQSKSPLRWSPVRFRAPYGYRLADLVTQLDRYVLLLRTLSRTGHPELGTREVQQATYAGMRQIRSLTHRVVRQASALQQPAARHITRELLQQELAPDASEAAANLDKVIGGLPEDVRYGERKPEFYRPVRPARSS